MLAVALYAATISGCGVKGKPLPPLEPAELGRGMPTYKRTAQEAKPTSIPAVDASPTPKPRRSEQ